MSNPFMSLFKRGKFWNYDFQFRGKRYQGTTYQTNKEEAAKWLRAKRTRLANGLVGLTDEGPQMPLLTDFLLNEFTKNIEQQSKTAGTKQVYKRSIKRFVNAPCFQNKLLDQITDKEISEYKQWRLNKGNTPATINGDLAVLRKALRWADHGLKLIRYPGVSSLPGANQRSFVVSGELEKEYLSVAPYPLKQVAILMLDLGLRPEEACALRKAHVANGIVSVDSGKTANARRSLPQTDRTRSVFQFMRDLFPDSEWVFPGREGKHLTAHSVSNLHIITRKRVNKAFAITGRNNANRVQRLTEMLPLAMSAVSAPWPEAFCLYALRHTWLTRLAESGCDVFTMKALAGHANIATTQRYVHPGLDHATVAMRQAELYAKHLRGEIQDDTSTNTDALRRR